MSERSPLGSRLRRRWLRTALPLAAITLLLAGGGFAALETKNVSSYAEGVWWALSLMTTVGFVGEAPETTGGRLLSAVLMLIGFGVLSVTTAVIASLLVREDEASEERREHAFEQQALQRLDELGRQIDGLEQMLSDREGLKGPPVVASLNAIGDSARDSERGSQYSASGCHQREEGVAICAVPGIDKARRTDRRPRECVAAKRSRSRQGARGAAAAGRRYQAKGAVAGSRPPRAAWRGMQAPTGVRGSWISSRAVV